MQNYLHMCEIFCNFARKIQNRVMAATQYNKYIWLVDTIRSAGKITKEEIDRRWGHANLNEYHETRIPDRTFFRSINEIEMLFDIEIKCLRSPYGGQYYIADSDSNSQIKQWLLSQFALSQSLDTSRELQDQILYEPIPAGTEYLTTIVEAMREKKMLQVAHLRFDSTEPPHELRQGLYSRNHSSARDTDCCQIPAFVAVASLAERS